MSGHRHIEIAALLASVVIAGCGTSAAEQQSDSGVVASSGERTGVDRNACDLLTEAEVSAITGVPVKARETNRETGRSDCGWFDADSLIRLGLVGYWVGGKESWDILGMSRGAAKDIIQQTEGVALDSVIKAGPVAGLGDKAFFSPILPSLVLKDNVLLEFTFPLLDNPELHFRPMVTKVLSRL